MTYYIAAPLLYKEVVVNNLSSFFFGVDEPVRPYHTNCITHGIIQPNLCHIMRKQDGTPYMCNQHKHHHEPTYPLPVHHKQELLAKVEALHFLNQSANEGIYDDDDDITSYQSPGEEQVLQAKFCDCPRYEDLPERKKDVTGHINPLPALRRASVGGWTEVAIWNMNHITDIMTSKSRLLGTDPTTASSRCRDFEKRLRANFPPFRCRFFCRHDSPEPLPTYLYDVPGDIEINIIHDMDFDYDGPLVAGALNIIHVMSENHFMGIDWIGRMYRSVASELHLTMLNWTDFYSPDVIGRTFIRFVLERHDVENNVQGVDDFMGQVKNLFNQQLASLSALPGDLKLKLDVCWADEEGDCPACQPDTCHPAYKTESFFNHLSRQEYDQRQKA